MADIFGKEKNEKFILVTYDIADPKRLRNVAKTMEGFGARVQYSVFEVELDDNDVAKMKRKLLKIIDEETDQIRFYRICKTCQEQMEIIGVLKKTGWDDTIII